MGTAHTQPRLSLLNPPNGRKLFIDRFPEYWSFRTSAPRAALIKALRKPYMSLRISLGCTCLFLLTLAPAPALAEDSGKYREFTLGSTVASVLELTGSRPSELRTVHDRPSMLQELVWRPRYSAGRALPDVDPVHEMIFSFSDDQLYSITVYYDRTRTAGLTHDDLILALKGVYGVPMPSAKRHERLARFAPSDVAMPLATWEQGDTVVSLSWSDYRAGYVLVVLSQTRESAARLATTAAIALDEREAPAREEERRKKVAEDQKAAEERARESNKGAFRP